MGIGYDVGVKVFDGPALRRPKVLVVRFRLPDSEVTAAFEPIEEQHPVTGVRGEVEIVGGVVHVHGWIVVVRGDVGLGAHGIQHFTGRAFSQEGAVLGDGHHRIDTGVPGNPCYAHPADGVPVGVAAGVERLHQVRVGCSGSGLTVVGLEQVGDHDAGVVRGTHGLGYHAHQLLVVPPVVRVGHLHLDPLALVLCLQCVRRAGRARDVRLRAAVDPHPLVPEGRVRDAVGVADVGHVYGQVLPHLGRSGQAQLTYRRFVGRGFETKDFEHDGAGFQLVGLACPPRGFTVEHSLEIVAD